MGQAPRLRLGIAEDDMDDFMTVCRVVPARLAPPRGAERWRWIDGQLCRWDDDPAEDFGQVWVPVCPWCRRGPLARGERTCGDCP
jgi:hypothetical protein